MTPPVIFTIGHSRHAADRFVELLLGHRVALLVDVRSKPRSRWAPQFGQPAVARLLGSGGIDYVFMGCALGGRPDDRRFYRQDGTVDFALRSRSPDFQEGVRQLAALSRARTTAILCAEEDPRSCHRRLLVGAALRSSGFTVGHIRGDARVELEDPEDPDDRAAVSGELERQLGLFGDRS